MRKKKPKHVFYLDKPGDRIVDNSAPLFWAPIGQIWVFWTKLWQRNELFKKKKKTDYYSLVIHSRKYETDKEKSEAFSRLGKKKKKKKKKG